MKLLVCSVAAAQFYEPALLSLLPGHQLSCCNLKLIPAFSQTFFLPVQGRCAPCLGLSPSFHLPRSAPENLLLMKEVNKHLIANGWCWCGTKSLLKMTYLNIPLGRAAGWAEPDSLVD